MLLLFVVWGVFFTDNLSAAPFVLGMICMCYSLLKELRTERLPERRVAPGPERAAPQQSIALDPGSGR